MNRSAIAKLKSEARPETITIETGSVTLTGAPAYGPGTQFEKYYNIIRENKKVYLFHAYKL